MDPKDLGVGSHVPFLAAAIMRSDGPVAEFGTGWWSTPLIHYMCKGQRMAESYETDFEWLKQMKQFAGPGHHLYEVHRWEDVAIQGPYGVAFVDCSMDRSSKAHHRPALVKRLKGKAKFIVCHDTEADIRPAAGDYGWAQLDGLFRFQSTFKGIRPWTTVYSDVEEFVL